MPDVPMVPISHGRAPSGLCQKSVKYTNCWPSLRSGASEFRAKVETNRPVKPLNTGLPLVAQKTDGRQGSIVLSISTCLSS